MKTISQHIEQLLCQHECIIVPELGGFVSYYEKAKIEGRTLHAPCKKVRFNSLLSYHDGLLAEAVMKERSMDYSSALSIIRHEVNTIKTELNKGNCVSFGKVGIFTPRINEQIAFNFKNVDSNFLPENIGLPTIRLNKIAKSDKYDKTKNIVIQIPKTGSNIYRYVASIAIIFLLTLFAPKTSKNTYTANLSFDSIELPNNSNDTQLYIKNTIEIEKQVEQTVEASEPKIQKTEETANYHIIIASFLDIESAEKYINEHTEYDYYVVEKNNKFRISEMGFSTYKEALNYFKIEKEEKNSWILKM